MFLRSGILKLLKEKNMRGWLTKKENHRQYVLDTQLSDSQIITISRCGELAGIDSENACFSFVKKNYHYLFLFDDVADALHRIYFIRELQ